MAEEAEGEGEKTQNGCAHMALERRRCEKGTLTKQGARDRRTV